LFLFVAF